MVETGMLDVDNPSLENVLKVLDEMDGHEFDSVFIMLSNGDSMEAGGGSNNQYKCNARTDGFYDLINPNIPKDMSDTMNLQVADEINTFPKCTIVTLKEVKNAFEYFYACGGLNPDLSWDNTLEYEPL
jgi:hypothetical protein